MSNRMCALLGVVGPLVAYVSIAASIASAPWFSWDDNALSDLGHAIRSEAAPIYNFGLAATGIILVIYSVTTLRRHAGYTSICLAASSFLLQLVAVFDEIYGSLHQSVSILFFVSLAAASAAYAIERRSLLAATAFVIGLASWILYGAGVYSAGVAVPEIISATAVSSWVVSSAFRTYRTTSIDKK